MFNAEHIKEYSRVMYFKRGKLNRPVWYVFIDIAIHHTHNKLVTPLHIVRKTYARCMLNTIFTRIGVDLQHLWQRRNYRSIVLSDLPISSKRLTIKCSGTVPFDKLVLSKPARADPLSQGLASI